MGNEVRVEIDRSATGGTFTNYDTLRGQVVLVVTLALALNYIQVKLEGVARTQVAVPRDRLAGHAAMLRRDRRRDADRKDKLVQDVHKVLYDTLVVFPPPNVRQVLSARDFTLAPGNYTYPFEFRIPLRNACVQPGGLTNLVLFNKKTFDVVVNSSVRAGLGGGAAAAAAAADHCVAQLPPSLSGVRDASISYYVKVTCKRALLLKPNLRHLDPFVFLPLDLDRHGQPIARHAFAGEYREVFFRKEVVFRERVPQVVAVPPPPPPPPPPPRGLLGLGGGSRRSSAAPPPPLRPRIAVATADVPFWFEVRFRDPAFVVPTKPPSFKLFLVLRHKPTRYLLAQYGRPAESNGLGVVYLQRLTVELRGTTTALVLERDGAARHVHRLRLEHCVAVCDNVYQNLALDLKDAVCPPLATATLTGAAAAAAYELEIPPKYYRNCVVPDHVLPSFATCNIERHYALAVTGAFSADPLGGATTVELLCPGVKVLSGLNMTRSLDLSANSSSTQVDKPPLTLPTYDDVVRQSSYQDDSEHIRARRRYDV